MQAQGQDTLHQGSPQSQWTGDYYVYPIVFASIGPNATVEGQIQIQADSDFQWVSSTYHAFDPASPQQTDATRLIPAATVQLTDNGSGRNLYDLPVTVNGGFGLGELPYILPIPRIFKARSSFNIRVESFDGVNTIGLRLFFHGIKLFSYRR